MILTIPRGEFQYSDDKNKVQRFETPSMIWANICK